MNKIKLKKLLSSISGINRRKITIDILKNIKTNYCCNSVLDIGSGIENWSYLFQKSDIYHTIDLRDNVGATFVGDLFNYPLKYNYDLIIATELLEHLLNSKSFFKRAYSLLEDDGILLISFPFFFKIHGDPHDYYRFTLEGIKELSKDDFEIIEYRLHGNRLQLIWEIFVDIKILYPLKIFNRLIAKMNWTNENYPLGYVIILQKKGKKYENNTSISNRSV